jgi:Kef-type K+ transport system membrane component KefB
MPAAAAPVSPLAAHQLLGFLVQVGILLGGAVLLGRLARRLGMPPPVGELAGGVLLGPTVLRQAAPGLSAALFPQRAEQAHLLDAVGQLGMGAADRDRRNAPGPARRPAQEGARPRRRHGRRGRAAAAGPGAGLPAARVAGLAGLAGRPLVRYSLRLAARASGPDVAAATVTAPLPLSAAGTHALGLEPALGTFLAGILIGSSGQLTDDQLTPLRTCTIGVLAPVFSARAGLRMDLTALGEPRTAVVAGAVVLVATVGKVVGAYAGARDGRLGHWEGLALGAGPHARGVVEIVVAMVAPNLGVLSGQMYTVIVPMALVTSLVAPPTPRFAVRRIPPPPSAGVPDAVLSSSGGRA